MSKLREALKELACRASEGPVADIEFEINHLLKEYPEEKSFPRNMMVKNNGGFWTTRMVLMVKGYEALSLYSDDPIDELYKLDDVSIQHWDEWRELPEEPEEKDVQQSPEVAEMARIMTAMTHHPGALEETKEQWLPYVQGYLNGLYKGADNES